MKSLKPALIMFFGLTIVTGLIYPILIFICGQIFFPAQANGSIVSIDSKPRGSELLAQKFESQSYFWARPSAADYGTVASGASNLGPTSLKLKEQIVERRSRLGSEAPVDLLTSSGSGLDPHISLEAAMFQIERVSKARKLAPENVKSLVERTLEARQWGFLGEARVNVLKLNLALDALR